MRRTARTARGTRRRESVGEWTGAGTHLNASDHVDRVQALLVVRFILVYRSPSAKSFS